MAPGIMSMWCFCVLVIIWVKIVLTLAMRGWPACYTNSDEAFLKLWNIRLQDCVRECELRSACLSISYSRTRIACTLLTVAEPTSTEPGHTCINQKKAGVPAQCSTCASTTRCEPSNGTCTMAECQSLQLEHGSVTGNMTTVGSRVVVECGAFYRLDPAIPSVRCQTGGTWEGNPRCILRSECGLPPDCTNARAISYDDVTDRAHYVCTEGLTFGGADNFNIQCQDDDTWFQVGQRCYKCPDDSWHLIGKTCYYTPGPATTMWYKGQSGAMTYCHNKGATLVELTKKTKNDAVKEYLLDTYGGGRKFWIALSDDASQGNWKWTETNTALTFTDWSEPPNGGATQDFAYLDTTLGWVEVNRWTDCSPLCEMEVLNGRSFTKKAKSVH